MKRFIWTWYWKSWEKRSHAKTSISVVLFTVWWIKLCRWVSFSFSFPIDFLEIDVFKIEREREREREGEFCACMGVSKIVFLQIFIYLSSSIDPPYWTTYGIQDHSYVLFLIFKTIIYQLTQTHIYTNTSTCMYVCMYMINTHVITTFQISLWIPSHGDVDFWLNISLCSLQRKRAHFIYKYFWPWKDRQIHGWINGWMDGWIDGWMGRLEIDQSIGRWSERNR